MYTYTWLYQSDDAALRCKLSRLYKWFQLLIIWKLKFFLNQYIQYYIQCKTSNMTEIYSSWILVLNLFWVCCSPWGFVLQEGWPEPSDQARGRWEGATATWLPSPLWQAEKSQWEPVAKNCSPSCIQPHHLWNRGFVHKGVFLSNVSLLAMAFYYLGLVLGNMF